MVFEHAPETMGALIRETFRAMVNRMDRQFADTDLVLSQWLTLKLVGAGTISCVGDVGREIGIETGASTRLVDQLEIRGLIVRSRSITDRRVVGICLTEAGSAAIKRIQPRLTSFWREHLEIFDGEELDLLFNMLLKLRSRFRSD